MSRHLHLDEFRGLLHWSIPWEEAVDLLYHLLTCGACCQRLMESFPEEGRSFLEQTFNRYGGWQPPAPGQPSERVRSLFESLTFGRVQEAKAQRTEARFRVEELTQRSPAHRRLLALNSKTHASQDVVVLLLEKSREHWRHDPEEAERLAELALELLGRMRCLESSLDPLPCDDLAARAWAYLGNSRRVVSNLRAADEAFQQARHCLELHLARGGVDPQSELTVSKLEAALRMDQERFAEALELTRRSIRLARQVGDLTCEVEQVLRMGSILGEEGRHKEAVELLTALCADIDAHALSRDLAFAARQTLAVTLLQAGRAAEAALALEGLRRCQGAAAGDLDLVKVDWLSGLVLEALGDHDAAVATLRRVRSAFLDKGIGFNAALVSLDLARLYLEGGRPLEARRLALEMGPLFESRDLHQHALAALLVLRQALEQQVASVSLVEEVETFLKRSRNRPSLAFKPQS